MPLLKCAMPSRLNSHLSAVWVLPTVLPFIGVLANLRDILAHAENVSQGTAASLVQATLSAIPRLRR